MKENLVQFRVYDRRNSATTVVVLPGLIISTPVYKAQRIRKRPSLKAASFNHEQRTRLSSS
jgi:hypothetical protein